MLPRRERVSRSAFPLGNAKVIRFSFGTLRMYAGRFAVSVVVSKKTARRAVDRHGIKRKVYAALSGLTRKPQGTCVFYPNQATLRVSSREITKELEMHFK